MAAGARAQPCLAPLNEHGTLAQKCISIQTGEDLSKKLVPALAQDPAGRSSLGPAPALTFLRASGSALLGALASKKLRLLATPSEDSKRLF